MYYITGRTGGWVQELFYHGKIFILLPSPYSTFVTNLIKLFESLVGVWVLKLLFLDRTMYILEFQRFCLVLSLSMSKKHISKNFPIFLLSILYNKATSVRTAAHLGSIFNFAMRASWVLVQDKNHRWISFLYVCFISKIRV